MCVLTPASPRARLPVSGVGLWLVMPLEEVRGSNQHQETACLCICLSIDRPCMNVWRDRLSHFLWMCAENILIIDQEEDPVRVWLEGRHEVLPALSAFLLRALLLMAMTLRPEGRNVKPRTREPHCRF
ncbi:hypothetical protein LIA77_08452 [Sarocladium implicatum]|nr:hypothetical protein LIA77_08452 [Sarocladium implicatum]